MKKYFYILAAMFIGATVLTGCSDDDHATPAPTPTPAPESDVVDLGLPSGTLWATANLGATDATETGNLYAWGETYTKTNFSQSNYFDPSSTIVKSNITGTQYDAAKAALGGDWVMPTEAQFEELFTECTVKNVTKTEIGSDGKEKKVIIGFNVIGPNEKELYLPVSAVSVEGEGTLYDNYLDEKGKETFKAFENVFVAYWTGDIASSEPQNANQYAVQVVVVEHAKDAVKKAGYDQYGAVPYNRSRLVGAPIRPVKANGGTPVAQYVDITGQWAQCSADGTPLSLDEEPFFLSFEGSNYSGEGVTVSYGNSVTPMSYSRDINEVTTVDEDGDATTFTVADVTTTEEEKRVISISTDGTTQYYVETEEDPQVPAADIIGKWDFTYAGEDYVLNILDDENFVIKNGTSDKISSTYLYRFGTIAFDTDIFDGTFAVEPVVGGTCPFQLAGEGTTIGLTEHPKSYETLISWSGATETSAPSIFNINGNNSLVDATTVKQDITGLDGESTYSYAVRLNKSVASTEVGKESSDKANIATNALLINYSFKTGDRIRIRGYVNGANKNGSFKVFDTNAIYLGAGAPNVANYAEGARKVVESVFTFTSDVKNVYISRQAGTGTFVCEFYIDRELDD